MRKNYKQTDLREILLNVAKYFDVSSLDKQKLINGLERSGF